MRALISWRKRAATMYLRRAALIQQRLSWWTRASFFVVGVVLPLLCFLLAGAITPAWQKGDIGSVIVFMLSMDAAPPTYPFMLYSVVCLAMVLVGPETMRWRWVRLGVYSGVVLCAYFSAVLGFSFVLGRSTAGFVAMMETFVMGAGFLFGVSLIAFVSIRFVLPTLASRLWRWFTKGGLANARSYRWRPLVVVLISVGSLLALIELSSGVSWLTFGALLAVATACLCAPFWALAVYGIMSFRVYARADKTSRFGASHMLAMIAWMIAFLSSVRWSTRLAMEKYQSLPMQPPDDCYVCAAASRGHRWFVGSQLTSTAHGDTVAVNEQLRVLKSFEILLIACWPSCHARLREIYDCIGPPVAARIRHPLLADLTYLALKPAEWSARAVLLLVVTNPRSLSDRIFRG